MKTVYAVKTIPVVDRDGATVGWIRVDLTAEGPDPRNTVYLRDGSAAREHEALLRISQDLSLVYPTREEAARDGLARLREAHARGDMVAVGRNRSERPRRRNR